MSTAGILLKEIKGFRVVISTYDGTFHAMKGEVKYDAKTLSELEEKIKRHESNARHFKPIEAIKIETDETGKITSFSDEKHDRVYFTHKETSSAGYSESTSKQTQRSEDQLISSGWGNYSAKPKFAKATQANLKILEQIQLCDAQIKQISTKQNELRKTYGDLVTKEIIDADRGP